ncbi:MAG: HD domain-containing protein [Deltaproteobacteria bacterium]|nr:HD domain-containing protein [Deltaproteobacteria bacterium]MCX7952017.1 HD domain-containing protein [Deltaproteobacteria bacterium]
MVPEDELLKICYKKVKKRKDPSHDIFHIIRVLELAKSIGKKEKADLEIVIPSAIFHDVIVYPKNHPKSVLSNIESAQYAVKVLSKLEYPSNKLLLVKEAIETCSFSKGLKPNFLEAMVLQDADMLESCGCVAIMRGFASAGLMNKILYHPIDPFADERQINDQKFAVDLFFSRYLKVAEKLNTKAAKSLLDHRLNSVKQFIKNLRLELNSLPKTVSSETLRFFLNDMINA